MQPLPQKVDLQYLTDEVLPHVFRVLQETCELAPDRTGAIFTLTQNEGKVRLVPPFEVGAISNGGNGRYAELAEEKPDRLLAHAADGHILSWQSRDPQNDKWGGAYNDGLFTWALSGLTEEQDEAFSLMAAHLCTRMRNGWVKDVAEISNNRIILDGDYLFWVPKDDEPEQEEGIEESGEDQVNE